MCGMAGKTVIPVLRTGHRLYEHVRDGHYIKHYINSPSSLLLHVKAILIIDPLSPRTTTLVIQYRYVRCLCTNSHHYGRTIIPCCCTASRNRLPLQSPLDVLLNMNLISLEFHQLLTGVKV